MDHPTIQHSKYAPDFHTDMARKLAEAQYSGKLSCTEYLTRTVPIMVGLQSQGKPKVVECIPVVVAMSEFLGVLTHDLIEIITNQSENSNENVQEEMTRLRVKWYGCGSKPFDGHDTLLLNNMNLASTLRLLKQRLGTDMILLEQGDLGPLAGQGVPGGHQKVSKGERKGQEGRNAVQGESGWGQRHGGHGDVMMEGTTPPGLD